MAVKINFTAKTKAEAAEINQNFIELLALNVYSEDFTVLTDGSTVTFVTASLFKLTTLRIYQAGARLRPGVSADYLENDDGSGNGDSFTLAVAPAGSTPLIVDYQKANV